MRARWWKWTVLGVVVIAIVVTGAVWLGTGGPGRPAPPPVPKAIVALGDSVASGEGAGSYTADTDGKDGNFCHRSTVAEVLRTRIDGYPFRYNLACSGARSSDITKGGRYREPPQTAELAKIAKQHPVGAIVVTVGANDAPDFSGLLAKCIEASLFGSPCSEGFGGEWKSRVDAMVPKVTGALRGVRDVMHKAGYRDDAYQLIVQSYAAPVGPDAREQLRNLNGCPFTGPDLNWVRGKGVGSLDGGLRRAADAVGARYLDMSRAGFGHEACSGTMNDNGPKQKPDGEWFNRLKVDWTDLRVLARADHAIASSFHPNAAGHAAFARCLSAFVSGTDRKAACVAGEDRTLQPQPADD
ncbi:GDSL-type esterase/lipase family protein [Sciscionella sediminilitoris]|uniref:GDSL-type esterase/lipase family protein n=1 Tax=Sciscionella sediminilitoris TaxID=1445613 RepID=UPI0004DF9465|nr:GDSL-type esterase/lipase family protein [Sciscionella sp. SE31]